jgi:hypothetical protein
MGSIIRQTSAHTKHRLKNPQTPKTNPQEPPKNPTEVRKLFIRTALRDYLDGVEAILVLQPGFVV